MSYIIQRQTRFYVVAYGVDPLTGKERRRWHAAGHDRGDAEAMATRLDLERDVPPPKTGGPITIGEFLTDQWMPRKRRQVRATTAYRYAWFADRYIVPATGDIPLHEADDVRRPVPDHVNRRQTSPRRAAPRDIPVRR